MGLVRKSSSKRCSMFISSPEKLKFLFLLKNVDSKQICNKLLPFASKSQPISTNRFSNILTTKWRNLNQSILLQWRSAIYLISNLHSQSFNNLSVRSAWMLGFQYTRSLNVYNAQNGPITSDIHLGMTESVIIENNYNQWVFFIMSEFIWFWSSLVHF